MKNSDELLRSKTAKYPSASSFARSSSKQVLRYSHANKKQLINRMNYLTGHLRGVIKMIEEDKYCIDIINQNQGVISAVKKVNQQILRQHLDNCIVKVVKGKSVKKKKQLFDEIVKLFTRN